MQLFYKLLYRSAFAVVLGCLCLSDSITAQQPAPTQSLAPEAGVTVVEVVVKGAEGKFAELVKQTVKIKPGGKATKSSLLEDTNAIFATGYFSNARAIPENTPKGTHVTFEVTVNPVLRRVEINGNTLIPQKVISETFRNQYSSTANLRNINEGIQKLTKWYQNNGYVLAQFVGAPNISKDGVVKLEVSEGVIENIGVRFADTKGEVISGIIPTDIILKEVAIKPGQLFNRNQVQKELEHLFDFAIFHDVNIQLEPGKDPKKVIVLIKVVENDYAPAFKEFQKQVQQKIATTPFNKARIEQAELLRWKGNRYTSDKKDKKKPIELYQAALKIFQAEKDIQGAATVYNNIGNAYNEQEQYEQAISNYQTSLKLKQQVKNKLGEAIVNQNLGNIYNKNEQYDKAVDSYNTAQKIFGELKESFWQALSLSNLASSYHNSENKDKAVETYIQAITSWKNLNPNLDTKIYQQNTPFFSFGLGVSTSQGIFFNADIQLDDKLLVKLTDKRFWLARTLFNAANTFQFAGDYQQAIYSYNDALELWQVIKKDEVLYSMSKNTQDAKDSKNINLIKLIEISGDILIKFNISNLYNDLGNKELSSQYKRQLGEDMKKNAPVIFTEISKADASNVIQNLAIVVAPIFKNFFTQQPNTELVTAEIFKDFDVKSFIENFIKLESSNNQKPNGIINEKVLNHPLLQYINLTIEKGDADKLLKRDGNKQQVLTLYQQNVIKLSNFKEEDLCFDQILKSFDQNNSLPKQFSEITNSFCFSAKTQQAYTLNSIAKIQLDLQQNQQAIESLIQALSLVQADASKKIVNESSATINSSKKINFNNSNFNDINKIEAPLKKFTVNNKIEEAKKTAAEALSLMGQAYTAKQQYQEALGFYNNSFNLYQDINDIIKQADAILGMAKVERMRDNLIQAKTQVERAIEVIESERAQITIPEIKKERSSYKTYLDLAKYLESKQNYYDFYIDLLMQLHTQQPNKGYDVLAFQASEGSKSRSLRTILNRSLNSKNTASSKTKYVELAKVSSLQEIQQQLLDDNTVLLEYTLGEERSYLWAVTKNSIQTYQLPKRSEIDKLSRQFIDLLKSSSYHLGTRGIAVSPSADVSKLPQVANQLSDILVAPVVEKLGKKRLLVVTDGALQYLPFAALPKSSQDKEVKPLLVEHEIIGLPSASLQILSQRKNVAAKPSKTLALLADPIFSRNDERVKMQNPSNSIINTAPRFTRLLGTRKEASQISALLPDSEKLVKLDSSANYSTATSPELSKYRFIHFATHGVFDSGRPERSGVIFSTVNEQGEIQRSLLSTPDAFKLNLSSDLVVLSACTTALGQEIKGEGLIGLTGGLMYAGSKSVVSSFWDVDDAGTAELMSKFYANMLKEKQSPSAALRNAQLYMWNSSQWQAPYYWAAFSIQGITNK